MRRNEALVALISLLLFTIVLYSQAGLTAAYLAADDFQWLGGGRTFTLSRLFQIASRNHFYRPVAETWFAWTVTACGTGTGCYHAASLAVHLLNIGLMFWLSVSLVRDLRVAFLAGLLFAIQPAATQAVVWISAVTGLLATAFCLMSLLALARSWTAAAHRTNYEIASVVLFALGLFSHEAAAMLPVLAWIIWREWGPPDLRQRLTLLRGGAAALGVFAFATVVANFRNYVFTDSHYAIGTHAIQHTFEYLVALYVGPGWWLPYLLWIVALAWLLVATPLTRLGALWMLVTMLPYVWFTWSNTSRYLYLPALGFGWAVAGAVVAACDAATRRFELRPRFAQAAYVVVVIFVAIRFGRFDVASIRSRIDWMEDWHRYALVLAGIEPVGGRVDVPMPKDGVVDPMYVEPMIHWIHQDFSLAVVIRE